MRVLVACEFSGIVREAFAERGHDAWSCDLLDTEIPGQHIKGNVLEHLDDGWDLMIAHPPCTYFANAGLHYLKTRPNRQAKLEESFEFIKTLWEAPIKRIALENPTGWLNTHWMKPSQIIQPSMFGTMELKTTCLWLKKLPPLMATYYGKVEPNGYCIRQSGNLAGKRYNYYWRQGKSSHSRARTFPAIAQAMAEQWG
jgi:site-specific DNA-cytosine methylase